MNVRSSLCVLSCGFLLVLAGGGTPALAAPTSGSAAASAAHPARSSQAVPAGLRPALYGALAKDAGPVYDINKKGCATLPQQKLTACFDAGGAHFTGAGTPLALHLTAWGRGGKLTAVNAVKPVIKGNQARYVHGDLTEWWRVLPMGFEQGFTIAKRASGNGELTLALAANDKMKQGKGSLASGKLRYGNLVVTDAKGKVVPATMKAHGNRVLIRVDDAHADYPLTVDPLVWLEQEVTASDGEKYWGFGLAIAISGRTAIVGARDALTDDIPHGAAYVFHESNGTWIQVQKLTPDNERGVIWFGNAVAFDGTTMVIGARGFPVEGQKTQGAVYVFTKPGHAWIQTARLLADDGIPGDYFGWSVALSGSNMLIGAPYAKALGHDRQGAAYVFTESDGAWTQTQELTASDGASLDEFGLSVALDGATALVSALSDSDSDPGAMYLQNRMALGYRSRS